MNKKRKIILISSLILLVIIITVLVVVLINVNNNKKYVSKNDVKMANDDTISLQKKVDDEIKGYINDKSYTLDSPKIILNPYLISPFTALIIFTTNDSVSYDVYINDVKFTKMEESKKHVIPIYGLKAGMDNKVKLVINISFL